MNNRVQTLTNIELIIHRVCSIALTGHMMLPNDDDRQSLTSIKVISRRIICDHLEEFRLMTLLKEK
jgi:hypothetical protein